MWNGPSFTSTAPHWSICDPDRIPCLRPLIYSVSDWTKVSDVGDHSVLSQIITDPEQSAGLPFFMEAEQEHGWCYYYQKMELALQTGDPEKAASLADSAFSQELTPRDSVEWIPVVESYVQTGRMEEAESAAENLSSDVKMERSACAYFIAKDDPAYDPIEKKLCGWMQTE